jgi:hypothetical protein
MVWPEKLVQSYDQLEFARVPRLLGKEKVPGSNPGVGSKFNKTVSLQPTKGSAADLAGVDCGSTLIRLSTGHR